jgi:hypothetical protein
LAWTPVDFQQLLDSGHVYLVCGNAFSSLSTVLPSPFKTEMLQVDGCQPAVSIVWPSGSSCRQPSVGARAIFPFSLRDYSSLSAQEIVQISTVGKLGCLRHTWWHGPIRAGPRHNLRSPDRCRDGCPAKGENDDMGFDKLTLRRTQSPSSRAFRSWSNASLAREGVRAARQLSTLDLGKSVNHCQAPGIDASRSSISHSHFQSDSSAAPTKMRTEDATSTRSSAMAFELINAF